MDTRYSLQPVRYDSPEKAGKRIVKLLSQSVLVPQARRSAGGSISFSSRSDLRFTARLAGRVAQLNWRGKENPESTVRVFNRMMYRVLTPVQMPVGRLTRVAGQVQLPVDG